ncbi:MULTISPECIES: YczE/YyaS/YitT family protein [Bacillus]|uniref:YitT family protein n=1 Tax=Bacillus glycinifermentans TaxID=1664069 RepID=A0AAJ3YVW5_9BACI|nr:MULTISPECIES: YitT family protein [Bacillus]KKB73625.1 membrane protein [Bacillus sp. TH008]MBU8785998.1 YitT family protein [Bacillus glycinifermentans]MDU0072238.1 YitT family protein [Bacillus sp. IG6]MED8019863.1 YitT family protein [Bacillus glycinifermentans]NUJ15466.1 YitT family protein [Bacillus glycinifermentans]
MKREFVLRWLFYFVGLIVLSFGVSLTIEGKALGIGPWDAFHYGLFVLLGLSVGQWSIIVGAVIVGLTSLFTKAWPKIGALLNMLLIGIFIDFFNFILPDPETHVSTAVIFLLGIVFTGYGVGIYVSANLGAGPRDSLMLLISEKTGWNVQWVRNGMELTILFIGWLLGGPIGIGTVLTAILTGVILRFSLPQSKRLLAYAVSGRRAEAARPVQFSLRKNG